MSSLFVYLFLFNFLLLQHRLILWAAWANWCYISLQSRNRKCKVKLPLFFYTKRTIMVAPWKSFQRGTSPECLPLVNSSPLVLCSSLPLGSSSPANASQLELDGIDTSMGTPTSPQTLWFQDERQRGAPLRDRSTKRCPIQRARRGGGPPTWWQMAREERLQSPCCWWCSHKVKF